MKTIGLLGLLSFLLLFASSKEVAGGPGANRSITLQSPVDMEDGGNLPAALSEYVFMHQARHEGIPVHAMAGVTSCPE